MQYFIFSLAILLTLLGIIVAAVSDQQFDVVGITICYSDQFSVINCFVNTIFFRESSKPYIGNLQHQFSSTIFLGYFTVQVDKSNYWSLHFCQILLVSDYNVVVFSLLMIGPHRDWNYPLIINKQIAFYHSHVIQTLGNLQQQLHH